MIIDIPTVVISGQNFSVSVFDPNLSNMSSSPYLLDVIIQFNNQSYLIGPLDDDGEIFIPAPEVINNTSFFIQAEKQGYENVNTTISVVLPPFEAKRLIITPEKYTIDANKQFTVTIFDETGNPIEDATVGVQNSYQQGTVTTTNADGRAVLNAPNKDTIIIIAQKSGYIDGQETLWVNTDPGFFSSLFENQYTAVIIAACALIGIIIYVSISNHHISSAYSTNQNNIIQKTEPPVSSDSDDPRSMRSQPKNSKIEEIRITRTDPQKTIVSLTRSEKDQQYHYDNNKGNVHKWFEGNKQMEHTIDSMTRTIDLKKEKKWYEGTDDIRKKIDRAINKKNE